MAACHGRELRRGNDTYPRHRANDDRARWRSVRLQLFRRITPSRGGPSRIRDLEVGTQRAYAICRRETWAGRHSRQRDPPVCLRRTWRGSHGGDELAWPLGDGRRDRRSCRVPLFGSRVNHHGRVDPPGRWYLDPRVLAIAVTTTEKSE